MFLFTTLKKRTVEKESHITCGIIGFSVCYDYRGRLVRGIIISKQGDKGFVHREFTIKCPFCRGGGSLVIEHYNYSYKSNYEQNYEYGRSRLSITLIKVRFNCRFARR